MNTFIKAVASLFLCLFIWCAYYFGLPALKFGFFGIPFIILVSGMIMVAINGYVATVTIILGLVAIVVLPISTSWGLFYGDSYHNLLGEVSDSVFSQDVAPVDISQMRIVDQSVANRIGEKRLGENPSLGSRAKLGEFRIQQVNGELYWVAPVEHSGFWKWKKFRTTPGYVKVSATNERDVEYVTQIDGVDIELKYQPGSFFSHNLHRHLYMNGYSSVGLTDFTFEIDDNGKPYWVVTLYEKLIGYSGENVTGVIVVDPVNGEYEEFSVEDAPSWVDRIQPESIVTNQITHWGDYVNGWWNSLSAKDGLLKPTEGMSLVYGEDGKSYWYTGISSVGKDGSTVGFMLIDTRSKAVHWYRQAGATETQAQGSAQGKVQEKGYKASFPVLYNVAGIPTYVMALKDNAGLIKSVAMVSVEDYGIVGVGNTTRDALRSYRSEIATKGNAIAPDGSVESYDVTGIVERISSDIRDGQTFYYMILDSVSDKMFIASSGISQEIPVTQVGDLVSITFSDGGSGVIDLSEFDNQEIQLMISENQAEVEERFNRAEVSQNVQRDLQSAERTFDDLSDEEKTRLLEILKTQEK